MDMHRTLNRGTVVLLAVALATSLLAPTAEAGRRHRDRDGHWHGPVIIERHSDAGAVVGFLGGLVLGAVLSNSQPAPPPPCTAGYDYYDPYCRETFGSLARYEDHLARHHHPRTAEVVEACSGRCVDTVRWCDGRWITGDDRVLVDERGDERGDEPPYEAWDD